MSIVGTYAELKVAKLVDFGVYLEGENEELILLPKLDVPENVQIDDRIKVFIYRDSEDRLIATTQKPLAQVGECAYLRVKAVNNMGAFLDWGLMKDLLVPFSEQRVKMLEDRKYLVYVYLDETTGRIVATTKLQKIYNGIIPDLQEEQEVDIVVGSSSDIGYVAVINNTCMGMIYKNEVFGTISEGQQRKAYIKKIRPDGKIDLSLQALGYYKEVPNSSERILQALRDKNGFLPLNDKSSPDAIYQMLEMSKKNFKKAIGLLYKQRMIRIDPSGIFLTPNK